MRAAALLLALVPPLPVTTIGAIANPDGSVTVFWTLPADPSVVGVTVFRDRLDLFEPTVEFVLGPDTSLTDFSTVITGSYRYRVHTRNAFGELSFGVFAEVLSGSEVVFVEDTSESWIVCWASSMPRPSLLPAGLAAALLALCIFFPTVRPGRAIESRNNRR